MNNVIRKKKILTLIIGLCSCLLINGQDSYSIEGNTSSGKEVGDNHVFHLNDMARFYIVDESGKKANFVSSVWSVEGMDRQDKKRVIVDSNASDYFDFNLDTTIINKAYLKDLKQTIIDNDTNVYNKVKIICKAVTTSNTVIEYEKTILLNILPGMPEIILMNLYVDENKEGYNSYADFAIIQSSRYDPPGRFVLREYNIHDRLTTHANYPDIVDQFTYYRYEFTYPFDVYDYVYATFMMVSINPFGEVSSPLFVINDSTVSEYRNTMSLEDVKTNKITLFPNPVKDYFTISGIMLEEIQAVKIIDLSGRVLKTIVFNQEPINISDLEKGLYHILVIYKNQKQKDVFRIVKY